MDARVVMVTGARRGIGAALAAGLAESGDTVVLHHLGADGEITAVAARCAERRARTIVVEADLADPAAVDALANDVLARAGRVDVLVNNAAHACNARWPELSDADWATTLQVNCTAAWALSRRFLPGMADRAWGRIINLASATVRQGGPSGIAYVASKAALVGLTRSLAREVGCLGVTVNAISPGAVQTESERELLEDVPAVVERRVLARQALPRRLVPDDLVGLARLLASPASDGITGQTIEVNGGTVLR